MATSPDRDNISTSQATPSVPTRVVTAGMIGAFVRDPTVFGSSTSQDAPAAEVDVEASDVPLDVSLERELFKP